jgi:hypothetical protein
MESAALLEKALIDATSSGDSTSGTTQNPSLSNPSRNSAQLLAAAAAVVVDLAVRTREARAAAVLPAVASDGAALAIPRCRRHVQGRIPAPLVNGRIITDSGRPRQSAAEKLRIRYYYRNTYFKIVRTQRVIGNGLNSYWK